MNSCFLPAAGRSDRNDRKPRIAARAGRGTPRPFLCPAGTLLQRRCRPASGCRKTRRFDVPGYPKHGPLGMDPLVSAKEHVNTNGFIATWGESTTTFAAMISFPVLEQILKDRVNEIKENHKLLDLVTAATLYYANHTCIQDCQGSGTIVGERHRTGSGHDYGSGTGLSAG